MASLPNSSCFEPHRHSLRCQSCYGTLFKLQSSKCCNRSISLCEDCFTDRKCPDCIKNNLTSGYVVDLNMAFVKISKIAEYSPGDIVMFHPVLERVGQLRTHLNLLHVDKPNPFVLLSKDSYQAFGLEQGKFCDIVIGRLSTSITRLDLQISREMSIVFGESDDNEKVEFFTVGAEPVDVKFPSLRKLNSYD